MKLHLGVLDVPYTQAPEPPAATKTGKPRKIKKAKSSATVMTGDVATILEGKYGVMAAFAEMNMPFIAGQLENSVAGALESILMGAPPSHDLYGTATSKIEDRFKQALDLKEFDGLAGVPTAASLQGVNRRLKVKKGGARPSFIDTGLYQASFKSWVDSK